MRFSGTNLEIFKIATCGNFFSRMLLKWCFFSKMFFRFMFEVFLAKIGKKNKVGKVRKYDEETEYLRKRFHPSKGHL